ncbi:MAG TPA: glycosyltransferase, partial [Terriglobales bacterium]
RAKLGLATTPDTQKKMRELGCRNVLLYPESGLPSQEILRLATIPEHHQIPFRAISIGRLLHWKGFDLGMRGFAAAQTHLKNSEYWIVGEGPERERLEQLARELQIDHQVRFWGSLPREQTLGKLRECAVLMHPSLHDSGGWVCLEAMAAGRPVICLDHGGPGVQVTENTGIKVRPGDPEQVVADIASALTRLEQDPEFRRALSNSGRKRVHDFFSWDCKGDWINDVYLSCTT